MPRFENVSLADSLRALPATERQRILDELSDADLRAIEFDWPFWARPTQLPPEGDWRVWMLLGGRGSGKTRTGAEWVRAVVETKQCGRLSLVAPTAADARDVLVEGESGLMAISPPHARPVYQSSIRRLTWPNGAIATLFSADEPDRLRGPQSDGAWADELCLVAGTKIRVPGGEIPIEEVRAGDLVRTRTGFAPVLHAWRTATAEIWEVTTTTGLTLRGTAGHPVWVVGVGFVPLSSLRHGDTLLSWDMLSFGAGGSDGIGGKTTTRTAAANFFTGRSTSWRMARWRPRSTSTTSTGTDSTTSSTTSERLAVESIWRRTGPAALFSGIASADPWSRLSSGAAVSQWFVVAPNAALGFPQLACERGSAVRAVVPPMSAADIPSPVRDAGTSDDDPSHASSAGNSSNLIPTPLRARASTAISYAPCVVSVRPCPDRESVFNLEVEGDHEYFANGFLTHNCAWRYPEAWDMLLLGLRLGADPRAVVTTTPRPSKIILDLMKRPDTHVTRETTYANAPNLAPAFMDQILARYRGTRLGRQEIDAEILTEVEGALWTRSMLERSRVKLNEVPSLARIVVAVDPAITAEEGSDETGIIVAGKSAAGHGFVLADVSCKASPHAWARRAYDAYVLHKADRIIGEVNQGGDMVENTIRTLRDDEGHPIGQRVAYRKVVATRGKYTRAEPVAALFEQGLVHLVGVFPELEEQLTEWVPGSRSPDRLDALVWALTELQIGPQYAAASVRRLTF